MQKKLAILGILVALLIAAGWTFPGATSEKGTNTDSGSVLRFGATGDGQSDETTAIERAIASGIGDVYFPKGIYRITRPIVIDLDKTGFLSLRGNGVARIVMAGPGPAFRIVGTHGGTAAPKTFKEDVWLRQRSPCVDGLEIVGDHPEACGIEAKGTMQLTLTRLMVRRALHAVHLVERNRNVTLSECHLYDNRGIGVFLDGVNLHQINIANCHISYNQAGGIVARGSELRNFQIGTCDIEGNMGGPDSEPTANVLLDSTDGSIAEVAIVGSTLQHAHDAPGSANIRIEGLSVKRPYTEERRFGNITIADNIFSDVQVNVEVRNARAVTITGNTFWQGYTHNLLVEGSANLVIANNVFDRNPLYHYGDGAMAKLGIEIADSQDCVFTGNQIQGTGSTAAVSLRNCRRMNVTNCMITEFEQTGLSLDQVSESRVSDCLICKAHSKAGDLSLHVTGGEGNLIADNLLSHPPLMESTAAALQDNVHP